MLFKITKQPNNFDKFSQQVVVKDIENENKTLLLCALSAPDLLIPFVAVNISYKEESRANS